MAIPDYQTLMLPVLRVAAGGEVTTRAAVEQLAREFKLTDEERAQLLPSGKQTVFANRVHWATTYMAKAGVVRRTRRGRFVATDRGLELLKHGLPRIDNRVLDNFEEFRAFRSRRPQDPSVPEERGPAAGPVVDVATPEERIETAYDEIDEELRTELLDRIIKSSPDFFEQLVIDLLVAMGYGAGADAGKRIGQSGDGGIDGIINEDALGLDIVYIQAKRYGLGTAVGVDKVREFSGAMDGRGAMKGVFVTTSHFPTTARDFAERVPKRAPGAGETSNDRWCSASCGS
jgi:restriction system protein